jgi:peroxiredoxin
VGQQLSLADYRGKWVVLFFYGAELPGNPRVTLLIDPEGRISRISDKVKPEADPEEVLQALG